MKHFYTVVLVAITLILTACGSINDGNVGVRTSFSKKVDMQEVPPGFYIAVTDSVKEYVGKEIEVQFNSLKPKANDNLSLAELDVSVYYTFDTTKVAEFVVKHSNMSARLPDSDLIAPGYALLKSLGDGVINDAASKFESLTFHTKRNEIEKVIKDQLQSRLDAKVAGYFNINNVVIRKALTDEELEASIRNVVKMQKQVEAKQHEKELAKAEAERQLEVANGVKAYNDMITKSITPELLEYKRIEMMKEFAKDGTHTVIMPSDSKSLINIK